MRRVVLLIAAFVGLMVLTMDCLLLSDSVPNPVPERPVAPPPAAADPECARSAAPAEDGAETEEVEADPMDFDGYPGQVPADSRGLGDSTLHLNLVGRTTGAPFPASVRLWRLGVPGDADWTEGDHIQAEGRVSEEGLTFLQLPVGRYRIESQDLRAGAEDPPEFYVDRGENLRVVGADSPRRFRIRVALLDEVGDPVHRALRDNRGSNSRSSSMVNAPDWAQPRRPRDGSEFVTAISMGMG